MSDNYLHIRDSEAFRVKLLSLFSSFIDICEKYDLSYFCIGGTLIGAVRHQGLIPWDDDIDIIMPRKDFEKLSNILTDSSSVKFDLHVATINNRYYLPFAKICDLNSTLIEHKSISYSLGIFIDIFILDSFPNSEKSQREAFDRMKNLKYLLNFTAQSLKGKLGNILNNIKAKNWKKGLKEIQYLFFNKKVRRETLKSLKKLESVFPSKYYINYGGAWGLKEVFLREWFDEGYIYVNFENMQVRIPKNYHNILTQMYGNYMILPPEKQRKTSHKLFYLNLDKRLSSRELNVIFK